MPKGIINNRNPLFTSKFWSKLYNITETKYKLLTAYHPQTDGQTKRVNQELYRYLQNYVVNKANTWSRILYKVEFIYNNQKYLITQVLPFQTLYGYNPHWIINITHTNLKVQGIREKLKNIRKIHTLITQS